MEFFFLKYFIRFKDCYFLSFLLKRVLYRVDIFRDCVKLGWIINFEKVEIDNKFFKYFFKIKNSNIKLVYFFFG